MVETKHLTVMFTDVKGFTVATSVKKREDFEKFLDLHEQLVVPIFEKHKGKVIKTIGDAFMVVFHSPTNAVLCGMEIQKKLEQYNQQPDVEEKVEVRVAINSGEVHIRKNDVYGEAVNIAARIESIAEANEIYFTESVYLSMNKSEIPSAEIGYRKLKGIPEEIKVYKVLREEKSAQKAHMKRAALASSQGLSYGKRLKNFWRRRKKWIIGIALLLLILAIIGDPSNIVKKEENVDDFIVKAEDAIANGNYEQASQLAQQLSQIEPEKIPPKLALQGAKLAYFLREPQYVIEMLHIAKGNFPNRKESRHINEFIEQIFEEASPEQQRELEALIEG